MADRDVQVNGRGPYQDLFRKMLLKVYGGCCAMCDTRHSDFLVASHIVPWSIDSRNRLNPKNGILLCRIHDAAFEVGVVRIAEDLSIEVVENRTTILGKDLRAALKKTRKRIVCSKVGLRPARLFLEWRLTQL